MKKFYRVYAGANSNDNADGYETGSKALAIKYAKATGYAWAAVDEWIGEKLDDDTWDGDFFQRIFERKGKGV